MKFKLVVQKSINVKWSSFFLCFYVNIVKIKKTSKFANKVLSNFEALTPRISKNEKQFAIIHFRKETKSETKI